MLGLKFQIADDRLALDVRRIVEVVPAVGLKKVVNAPSWLAGVCLYRGHVVPIVDLHRLAEAGDCSDHLSTRIIIVRTEFEGEVQVIGLRASQVADISELPDLVDLAHASSESDRPDFGRMYVNGDEIIHLVDLERLLPSSCRRTIMDVTRELSAWT